MKKILGLDLGTNSIGWALVENDFEKKAGKIVDLGSRIIPMSQDILGKFDAGQSISQTAERTGYRGTRRLYQRDTLRRERLHRVLNILGFLPSHYSDAIDFEKNLGQFKDNLEPKINYRENEAGKYEFIFKASFYEMVNEFKKTNPELFHVKKNGEEAKIPYDWTIYYLRKKALKEKVSREELAWIILNFNQKRGYYQLRGEEEEASDDKQKTFEVLEVKELVDSGDTIKNSGDKLYDVFFTNGWKYDKQVVKTENWIGKTKEFIVTTSETKSGEIKRTYKSVDSEKDWIAIKKKTENDINNSGKFVCEYIYETLLQNPDQKIRGNLIKTIERKYYKYELEKILETQIDLQPNMFSNERFNDCIQELYPKNEAHQNNLKSKGFKYLFVDDIIFYQRPLKSKKSTISGCQYECRPMRDKEGNLLKDNEGKQIIKPIQAISKSHPLYQEFRLWQFLKNLKIYKREMLIDGKTELNADVTNQMLKSEEDWVELFDNLNMRKEVEQKHVLDFMVKKGLIDKKDLKDYRWNYVEDKKYPGNATNAQFLTRLKKVEGKPNLKDEQIIKLWHIIYSVKDKKQFEIALGTFAEKSTIDKKSFVEAFKKFPPFDNDYGAYSEKALKKLLPIMRRGKYWNEEGIPDKVKERVGQFMERVNSITVDEKHKNFKQQLSAVSDDDIPKQLIKSFLPFKDKNPLAGHNTYQACYAVYGRHSEASEITKWKKPDDIDKYLHNFKQHSLRNPIVEQIVTETLRTVRDIWKEHGDFDEIHLELGREMKNPADKRKQIAQSIAENENTNNRIKQLLTELMSEGIEDIKPYSPSQQEILKIYEEGVYLNIDSRYDNLKEDEVEKIRRNSSPSSNEIKRYKLWLEQGYISPYTGEPIQLSELFTENFQIEHIIPQSRFFDDSLSNKVICESEINPNPWKDKQTGYEFIKNLGGKEIPELSRKKGKTVKLFTLEQYEEHCKKYFGKNNAKLKKLLSEDIPDSFIERQLNDTRYISKLVKGLLSNIVREEGEQEATSKNLIPVTGAITSILKQDWGLNEKWNELVSPRFIRLNKMEVDDEEGRFGFWDTKKDDKGNDTGKPFFRVQVPDEISKGFSTKRIDHRHHAMDALVIACTKRKHIQYLNSLNNEKEKYDLQPSLLVKNEKGKFKKQFEKPWPTITPEAKDSLDKTIVSFKQNLRVINRTNNKTWQWVKQKDGKYKKELVPQEGKNFAIRKPMHKDTVSGKVSIQDVKQVALNKAIDEQYVFVDKALNALVKKLRNQGFDNKKIKKYFRDNKENFEFKNIDKVDVYYFINNATSTRLELTDKFTEKQLEKVTDSGIKKILEKHASKYKDDKGKPQFDLAFNSDGIEDLNMNIAVLNNGKSHKPIKKVRIYEEGSKFEVSQNINSNKNKKYVEAAKGTNLFFVIYWDEEKQKRVYDTVPLNEVIEHQKSIAHLPANERTPIQPKSELGKFLFTLSPNDLVFVPNDEEIDNPGLVDFENLNKDQVARVYKMVSSSGNQAFFMRNDISTPIANKKEFGPLNKLEKSIDERMIKERCWKLKVNRLGKIVGKEIHT
jgi:CRISPR-associated endonuclease Csn1